MPGEVQKKSRRKCSDHAAGINLNRKSSIGKLRPNHHQNSTQCTVSKLQIRQRMVVYLKDPAGAKQQVIWLHSAERRPFSMNFNPLSIEYAAAYLPTGYKLEPNDQLEFEVSEAQSFVERSLALRSIRIADYAQ